MSGSITLLTRQEQFGDRASPLIADRVVGIVQPYSRTISEYGTKLTGREGEVLLTLSATMIGRVVEFFERVRATPPTGEFYDCHRFVQEVLAEERCLGFTAEPEKGLQAGYPYGIMQDDDCVHSLLGINDSKYNLSVLGLRAPLAVTNNKELLRVYDGDEIMSIFPNKI